ncbi:MAG: sulfurtransferase TusA family protein [Gammaproteobacteria bacterium]|nr:sulfurtransferase TusA family protein [Gammaproteobacteria bacterium]
MLDAKILVNEEELTRYEEGVQAFLKQQIDGDRFQSMRLQQGVYGQRQEGVNMVRVKLPGGRLSPDQAIAVAEVLEKFSNHDVMHITTRQAIQIHHVPLAKTPLALRHLAASGLTSREACNNTVRNISACPLAGLCASEHTDIQPFLEGAVSHFLRHPLAQHLPRKFKISFSGCETDCAQGMLHDMAVVAVRRDGRFGFKILAGGGLGHKPRQAIVVEEFIEEQDLLASMEAVIAVHNRYSDRKKRAKSRIKFLVERFTPEGFVEKYREELPRTRAALAGKPYIKGEWITSSTPLQQQPGAPRQPLAQKQPGLFIVPVHVPIGDISADQMRGIALLLKAEGLSELRTTQDQKLILTHVPAGRVTALETGIKKLGLGLPSCGDSVVACPGTSTCRLGITSSKVLGAKLDGGKHDLRIRVSGCHNGCAQPETGDIGIYGEGKRLHGKLIPHYQMYIGGDGRGSGGLAFKSVSVPAARIERAIGLLQDDYAQRHTDNETFFAWSRRQGKEYFDGLLEAVKAVSAEQLASVTMDHGDSAAFKVLQLGGGECSGAAQENVAANFAEAANERNYRNAFMLQRKYTESIECAEMSLRLIGNSLLFLAGQPDVQDLPQLAQQIAAVVPGRSSEAAELTAFADRLATLKDEFDLDAYTQLTAQIDDWTVRAASACQTIDRQLDLSASVASITARKAAAVASSTVIDLSTYGCPMHYIKARNTLREFQAGDVIDFLFASGDPASQASSSLKSDGHQILRVEDNGDATTRVSVRKAG